MKLTQINISS